MKDEEKDSPKITSFIWDVKMDIRGTYIKKINVLKACDFHNYQLLNKGKYMIAYAFDEGSEESKNVEKRERWQRQKKKLVPTHDIWTVPKIYGWLKR